MQNRNAIAEVIVGDKFWMFPGDEQNVAEALFRDGRGLASNLFESQGNAENWVVAREAAILAVIDAFVRKIEWCEKTDYLAKTLLCQVLGTAAKFFQVLSGRGRDQGRKISKPEFPFREKSRDGLLFRPARFFDELLKGKRGEM